MANERLYQFPSKASPVPADIVYVGDSANSFNEVNSTIAQLISAYPNLSGIGGLTLGANTFIYSNNSSVLTAGSISALAVTLLADASASAMQSTLGYQSTPIASQFAGWDANNNLSANSFINGYATTPTAAGTTTLTVGSANQQFFTGTTTQTVLLPVTSTLVLGQTFRIVNNSTGSVTVQSSGANNIQVMAANTSLVVTCILTTGTTAASWYSSYAIENALTLPLAINQGGTGVSSVTIAPTASAWAGWDANKNLSANSLINAFTTTATAGGTTVLTVGSTASQFFTGSSNQTVTMPVASTLAQGQQFYIVNQSSGTVTVQSSGANTIVAMAANTSALFTCILNSGTTAASWFAEYEQSSLTLPLALSLGGSGASLTASNGGIVYTNGSTMAILAGTATANLPMLSGASAAPVWGSFALSLGGALTTAGAHTMSGAFASTFTLTNTTNVTFPTSGTLAAVGNNTIPAWLNYNGSTPGINNSNNVSGVVRNSTGNYTISFTVSFADANYALSANHSSLSTNISCTQISSLATGSATIITENGSGVVNPSIIGVVFAGV